MVVTGIWLKMGRLTRFTNTPFSLHFSCNFSVSRFFWWNTLYNWPKRHATVREREKIKNADKIVTRVFNLICIICARTVELTIETIGVLSHERRKRVREWMKCQPNAWIYHKPCKCTVIGVWVTLSLDASSPLCAYPNDIRLVWHFRRQITCRFPNLTANMQFVWCWCCC